MPSVIPTPKNPTSLAPPSCLAKTPPNRNARPRPMPTTILAARASSNQGLNASTRLPTRQAAQQSRSPSITDTRSEIHDPANPADATPTQKTEPDRTPT